jgi:serine/threonine protein kinase
MSEVNPVPATEQPAVVEAAGKQIVRWGLESPDELIGSRIDDRFTIVERIARGGMGAVFKAIQAPMGRVCAVKVLSATYEGKKDPAFDKRFFREAATIARLRHPNTVTLYDYGNSGDLYYMVMEYVGGRTLHSEIHREGRLEERRARRIAMQICRSMREAHEHGVVHRDLKPDNILLVDQARETDLVKVLDFGLAKVVEGEFVDEDVTETGLCMGSPKHMAPEQITGDVVSAHTDIYALGVVMYEMLTAVSPFDRPTRYQTLVAQVHEAPPPFEKVAPDAEISAGMERLVLRCLHKERHHRYPSMNAVLKGLKELDDAERAKRVSLSSVRPGALISSIPSPLPVRGLAYVSSPVDLRTTQAPVSRASFPPASDQATLTAMESLPPLPGLPEVEAPKSRRGPALVAAGLGVAGMICALGVWLHLRSAVPTGEATSVLSGFSAAAQSCAPKPPVREAPYAMRKVRVDSDPRGATVYEREARLCMSTPCELQWPVADGDVRELRFSLPGYAVENRRVGPTETDVAVAFAPARRAVSSAKADGSGDDLANDTSYKYSPY